MFNTLRGLILFTPIIHGIAQENNTSLQQFSNNANQSKQVLLKLSIPSSSVSAPIDTKLVEKETRNWLASVGINSIESASQTSDKQYILNIEIQTIRTRDQIYIHNIMGRCSLLSDANVVSNEPGKEQKIWFSNHISGQVSDKGFQDNLIASIIATLKNIQILQNKPTNQSNQPNFANYEIPEIAKGAVPHEFNFSKIKVRKKPPAPPYPASAKSKGIQGEVVVDIFVNESGVPIRVEALSGPSELFITAIRYALRWEFEPATVNGLPVPARFKLNLPFTLRDNHLSAMPRR